MNEQLEQSLVRHWNVALQYNDPQGWQSTAWVLIGIADTLTSFGAYDDALAVVDLSCIASQRGKPCARVAA